MQKSNCATAFAAESFCSRAAIRKAAEWSWQCRQDDGGFNHFGSQKVAEELNGYGRIKIGGVIDNAPSEMDASYFQSATLFMAGVWKGCDAPNNNWSGWGHTLLKGSGVCAEY